MLITLPLMLSLTQNMDSKGLYASLLVVFNLIAGMAFFVQFPLVARYRNAGLFSHVDKAVTQHKKVGQWIGVAFFLHPLLILAPRLLQSSTEAYSVVMQVISEPSMLTGVAAWVMMTLWVLMSIFKQKLPISYPMWRLQHTIGFIVIAVLVTFHLTSVGSHGQFQQWFNIWWWGLCVFAVGGAVYNYLAKPFKLAEQPFELSAIERLSSSDWEMTITAPTQEFDFKAGQFVWLATHSAHNIDYHPFSIASSRNELPKLRFIIRELGDFTSQLGELDLKQPVYVNGPFGQLTLDKSEQCRGLTLVAGGAGIGPMMGLIRQLKENQDQRPLRLVYGNQNWSQMSVIDELKSLEKEMPNFQLFTVTSDPCEGSNYQGVIDLFSLASNIDQNDAKHWAVYACGPSAMIKSVESHVAVLGVKPNQLFFEQLSF